MPEPTIATRIAHASYWIEVRNGVSASAREIQIATLPGLLLRPRGARALYVLAHGAGAGMRHPFMAAIAGGLAQHGIATLRWEFPYMAAGKKRPDRPEVAEAAVRDVWRASKQYARGLPRFAGGKSFGGRMTLRAHAAEPLAELRGIAFLGFPLHPPDRPAIERAEHLAAAIGPLLFVSGTRDDLAELALLRPVVKRLGPRATLHLVDGADHGFSVKPAMIEYLASTIAAWIDTILDSA
jgi:predicted alpha/beta-hydrolase family hydrolase